SVRRGVGVYLVAEALRNVHGDGDALAGAFAAELGEERAEGVAVLALAHPHDAAALVVPHDGQELVLTSAVADLVDADVLERLVELPCGGLLDPTLDEPHHARPVQAELAAHAGDGRVASSRQYVGLELV